MQTSQRRVLLFLVLTALFAAVTFKFNMGALATMWGPGVAALITSIATRRKFSEFGWKPWPAKWLAAGWLIPVCAGTAAYSIIWATGLGAMPNPTFLQRGRVTIGMHGGPDWLFILAAFGFITVINLLPNLVFALGEELGWRGLLVPELARFTTFRRTAILSGVFWGVWHLPMILSGPYRGTGTPLWYQITCFSIMVVATGVVAAWLRLRSGSIWPVAIFHAAHNGAIQIFFDPLTRDTGHTHYFTGEFGCMLLPFYAAAAIYCLRNMASESASSRSAQDFRPVLRDSRV